MKPVAEILRSKGLPEAVAWLLLATLVWIGGPYLGVGPWQPLVSVAARVALILLLVLAWALWRYLRWRRDAIHQQRMAAELAGQGSDGAGDSLARADQEQMRLRTRFAEAMTFLRKRRRDGRGLDTLPWYLLIGAPGSGKSTLLQNSGLDFPLKEHLGRHGLPGVGGTRNCDWWFADQAVFLDSAGRYTKQDSDAVADSTAWQGFLDLLRRHRRRPLNGVIVAVSAADLLEPDEGQRLLHARSVRRRLDELGERLRATVPVYVMITKCDLVSGFAEFFANLDAAARAQVWGVSFPHDRPASGDPVGLFAGELERLLERIDGRVLERLHASRDPQQRAAVLSFPQQMRLLQPALAGFVQAAFGHHGYAEQPWLRGVYLTSGTQQGHPVDRVLSAVARHFGIAASRLPASRDKPRTYFVSRLLNDVLFAEAGLAGGHLAGDRRRRLVQLVAWVALTVSTLLLLSGIAGSYTRNRQLIADVHAALAEYPAGGLREATSEQAYYVAALQRFDVLERARDRALPSTQRVPWSRRFGLHQGRALAEEVQTAYLRDLNGVLLPALAESLRNGLAQAGNEPQRLYQLLKGYLMLGDPAHRDAAQLAGLAGTHWRKVFPEDAPVRAALDRHLRALLGQRDGGRALPLDKQQIEQARATLRTAELPSLVYGGLTLAQSDVGARSAPRLDRRLGLLGEVFRRRSDTPLSEPLPALYTRQAFQAQSGGGIDRAVQQFLADDWVLGTGPLDALGRSQLSRQVLALYQRDYIDAWDGLLADLELRPVSGMSEASAVAAKLGGPGSPLKALLELVREHTHGLSSAPASATPLSAMPDPAGEPIERHFEPLNRLLEGERGATPLDQTLETLDQMSRSLLTASAGGAADQNDPTLLIAAQQAAQLPPPLSSWVAALAGRSRALVADNAGELLRSGLRQAAGPDCALFVGGRYPFSAKSAGEIPLRDFAELFGNGGRFDRFFQQALAVKVDTSGRAWRWNDGMRDVAATDVLARAQLTDHIRQSFFTGGGAQPQLAFTVSVPPQPGIGRLQLEVDGQTLDARSGAVASMPMVWPGPRPGLVRIAAWDGSGRALPVLEYRGTWAWFRALQAGRIRAQGDLDYVAGFALGSATARIGVQPASLRHPFADTSLQRFRCP